ncbi:hypothetical protein L211DRAFT_871381 [Terfezia boudieri ATCC MYA-4762]|uniref:Uncharacterized protein n=1 Tax=Terfezia boudieri ATCC MYA-4762 TaxID=1051890 RepID=A0A3N4LCQ0_9PEZI|nr:hypothetical protein L211DRAFT_871381 [Terfezia boudieri ATCC MYA-4762]
MAKSAPRTYLRIALSGILDRACGPLQHTSGIVDKIYCISKSNTRTFVRFVPRTPRRGQRLGLLRSQHTNPHFVTPCASPATFLFSCFTPHAPRPHAPIHPHLGPVISTVITETANLSPAPFNSYGSCCSCIEAGYMFPLVGLVQLPWLSGEKFKNYVHGEPIFSYTCHPFDRDSLIEGLFVAGQVLLTGASEIVSSIRGLPPYLHSKGDPNTTTTTAMPKIGINTPPPAFREWQKSLRALASKADKLPLGSAHQMGSNRMCGVSWENGDSWESALIGRYGGMEGSWIRRGECMGWRECSKQLNNWLTMTNTIVNIMTHQSQVYVYHSEVLARLSSLSYKLCTEIPSAPKNSKYKGGGI